MTFCYVCCVVVLIREAFSTSRL